MHWLVALVLVAPVGAEPPDLDEVVCTWCHFDEGDDFAASVHYHEGHILCNDCHGGLPFEEDPDLAKAEGTGFIGKPGRDRVAQVCAQCHSGPAGFFAQGPHHDWANEANPTCVTCHGNHGVLAADLSLIDATCGECHDEWSAALDRGRKIKIELAVAAEHLARVGRVVDSLGVEVRAVRTHVHEAILKAGHRHHIDPDQWRPLVMSFLEFYGLGPRVRPSHLAEIF